jgi:uncharacterized membrane protein YfcA
VLGSSNVADYSGEVLGMLAGGVVAAWVGAGLLAHISKERIMAVIAFLLLATAALLAGETLVHGAGWSPLAHDSALRIPVAIVAGLFVGAISSLLGVAGGEFIIPVLVLIFGTDIRTAGTAGVLISLPMVLTGVARHWLTGHYRSRSMFQNLILPMLLGSFAGAAIGGYLAAWAPTDALRIVLAAVLALSAIKLWIKSDTSG